MTMTIEEALDSITDPDMLYWATVLSDLNALEYEVTHLLSFGLNPTPAFDTFDWERRYRLRSELGIEATYRVSGDTVFAWIMHLAPTHTYSEHLGVGGTYKWERVDVVLQEEPKIICTWTRKCVSEVLLSGVDGGVLATKILPLPFLKSQFERVWVEAPKRTTKSGA